MVPPRESTMEVRRRESLYSEGWQLEELSETGLISSKRPFESYKCYVFEKRKPVFNITKDAFSKADSGILRNIS